MYTGKLPLADYGPDCASSKHHNLRNFYIYRNRFRGSETQREPAVRLHRKTLPGPSRDMGCDSAPVQGKALKNARSELEQATQQKVAALLQLSDAQMSGGRAEDRAERAGRLVDSLRAQLEQVRHIET